MTATLIPPALQEGLEELIDAAVALRTLAGAKPAHSLTLVLTEDGKMKLLQDHVFIPKGDPGDVLEGALRAVSQRPSWRAAKPHLSSHAGLSERCETALSQHERAALLPVAIALLKEGAANLED